MMITNFESLNSVFKMLADPNSNFRQFLASYREINFGPFFCWKEELKLKVSRLATPNKSL